MNQELERAGASSEDALDKSYWINRVGEVSVPNRLIVRFGLFRLPFICLGFGCRLIFAAFLLSLLAFRSTTTEQWLLGEEIKLVHVRKYIKVIVILCTQGSFIFYLITLAALSQLTKTTFTKTFLYMYFGICIFLRFYPALFVMHFVLNRFEYLSLNIFAYVKKLCSYFYDNCAFKLLKKKFLFYLYIDMYTLFHHVQK